jgi:Rrf2 family protein
MLSKKTQYALQALGYLSAHYEKGPLLIGAIAAHKNIPLKFLENILLELKNAGILESYRGRCGGYQLKEAPEKTNLATIIRIVDGPIAMLSCVSLNFYKKCDNCDQVTCRINPVMAEARDALLKVLYGRTLADIRDAASPTPPKEGLRTEEM